MSSWEETVSSPPCSSSLSLSVNVLSLSSSCTDIRLLLRSNMTSVSGTPDDVDGRAAAKSTVPVVCVGVDVLGKSTG